MRTILIGSSKHLLFALGYGLLGIIAAALFGAVWTLNDRSDLKPWHTAQLKGEYHQQMGLSKFSEYLALEQKLFAQLDNQFNDQATASQALQTSINRYDKDSLAAPSRFDTNWNRSYDWPNNEAEFGVLLIHGMSDSPYALSHFATHFKASAHVLGLRLPGHGTLPSGLTGIHWPDLAGAVSLATSHMKASLKGKPLYVIGFSTGAALALNHELENIEQGKSSDYQGMVMLSPAIGLAPIAAMAKWQASLGRFLGQDKLLWNSIRTEYDPFKYQSFAVNAGDVVYQLSMRNQQLLKAFTYVQKQKLPKSLIFQSIVDDTVSTQAVISDFYRQLPLGSSKDNKSQELVLFDVNRSHAYEQWLLADPLFLLGGALEGLLGDAKTQGTSATEAGKVTLVENISKDTASVQARELGQTKGVPLGLAWPEGVYSLSHVALPYPVNDPLYGVRKQAMTNGIQIGGNVHQGERGLFGIPADDMLRQKWNPFFPYMLNHIDEFMGVSNTKENTKANVQ
jgi:alpha-beta hydrolase superfamily lysophospholipase